MVHFHPPGRSGDFARSARAEELAQGWDAIVDSWLTRAVETSDGLFFNPAAPDAPAGEPVPVVWDAFPLVITSWFDGQPDGDRLTFEAAESLRPLRYSGRPLRAVRDGRLAEDLEVFHRQQDEYCEWFVERRDDGGIARVWFTGEGPEYWEFLASGTAPFFDEGDPRRDLTPGDPDLLLALYREHVSPAVELADLFWQHDVAAFSGGGWVYYARAGDYNPLNRWTTTHGLMHLTHPANSLAAAVGLASAATVLRTEASDAESFACCAGFAEVNRSSDPLIGFGVNQAARAGRAVALADPVGLYIAGLNTGVLDDPSVWTVTRGSAEEQLILRARVEVPPGATLTVAGVPLEWGGQLARHIGMVLTGLVAPHTGAPPGVRGCAVGCCTHPDRPSFRTTVPTGEDCASVDWTELEPYLPGAGSRRDLAGLRHGSDPDMSVGPRPSRRAGDAGPR